MKRAFSIVLTLCLSVAALVLLTVAASAATEGIYTYEVADGRATITGCDDSASGEISIPATLGGCPVTAIGDVAFAGFDLLEAVTVPDSVTRIGSMAFNWCSNLSNINLPETA